VWLEIYGKEYLLWSVGSQFSATESGGGGGRSSEEENIERHTSVDTNEDPSEVRGFSWGFLWYFLGIRCSVFKKWQWIYIKTCELSVLRTICFVNTIFLMLSFAPLPLPLIYILLCVNVAPNVTIKPFTHRQSLVSVHGWLNKGWSSSGGGRGLKQKMIKYRLCRRYDWTRNSQGIQILKRFHAWGRSPLSP